MKIECECCGNEYDLHPDFFPIIDIGNNIVSSYCKKCYDEKERKRHLIAMSKGRKRGRPRNTNPKPRKSKNLVMKKN